MDNNEVMFDFYEKRKSTKAVVERFIDEFQEIYNSGYQEIYEEAYGETDGDIDDKAQELLRQCVQQMFRKYYYSQLVPDTPVTPASIVNTLVERELGKDIMALPEIRITWGRERVEHFNLSVTGFGIEDHFFIKDMDTFLSFAEKGVKIVEPGIIPDDCRGDIGDKVFINDRHYINIISMLSLNMGYLSEDSRVKDRLFYTNEKAHEYMSLKNSDKLEMIIMGVVKMCSKSMTGGFPALYEDFSEERLESILKNPVDMDEILKTVYEKLGIDIKGLREIMEKDIEEISDLPEEQLKDIAVMYNLGAMFDMYFTVPFGYYLQLIQPVYPEIYSMYLETGNILGNIDDLKNARAGLFSQALRYDLTPLGEKILLHGKRSDRKQALPEEYGDDEMYKTILESKSILEPSFDMEEIFDDVMKSFSSPERGKDIKPRKGKTKDEGSLYEAKHDPELEKKVFVFKVKLYYKKRVWREIEIKGSSTLHDLHKIISKSFELEGGHLYSFFMSNKAWDSASEYSHPQAEGRPADKITIAGLDLSLKQKFLYLFDYGDEQKFEVELVGLETGDGRKKYPCMSRRNKPSVTVCDECKSDSRSVEWFCTDHEVYLCGKCAESEEHEDCYIVNAIL